jgi:hypothetical protein
VRVPSPQFTPIASAPSSHEPRGHLSRRLAEQRPIVAREGRRRDDGDAGRGRARSGERLLDLAQVALGLDQHEVGAPFDERGHLLGVGGQGVLEADAPVGPSRTPSGPTDPATIGAPASACDRYAARG